MCVSLRTNDFSKSFNGVLNITKPLLLKEKPPKRIKKAVPWNETHVPGWDGFRIGFLEKREGRATNKTKTKKTKKNKKHIKKGIIMLCVS